MLKWPLANVHNHWETQHDNFERSILKPELIHLGDNIYGMKFKLMKAIPAFYIIKKNLDAIRKKYNSSVAETSSGTFGLGLAYACAKYNLKYTLISDKICDESLSNRLQTLGANVIIVDKEKEYSNIQEQRLNVLKTVLRDTGSYWPMQYKNPDVWLAYKEMIKPIKNILERKCFTHIVYPVGSGGSSLGISKSFNHKAKIVALDSIGSSIFGRKTTDRELRGVGSSIPMNFTRETIWDRVYWIQDLAAFASAHEFYNTYHLLMGPTSTAGWKVAKHITKERKSNRVLVIMPDGGERYLSSVFNKKYSELSKDYRMDNWENIDNCTSNIKSKLGGYINK